MKTKLFNILKRKVVRRGLATCLMVNGFVTISAQVQNNGNIYISDNANMYLVAGSYNFGGSPSSTTTSRTATTYGKLSFAPVATSSGASNTHYVDGFARAYSNAFFVLPVGQSGVYAPLGVLPSDSNGVDGAYFRQNPSAIGTSLDSGLFAVSTVEYWAVFGNGNASKVSLTWRSTSGVATLTSNLSSNLAYLSIVGWDGVKWVEIPSVMDVTSILGTASTISSGSITSTADVDLSSFNYFTIALKNTCAPLIGSSGITKTWNGSWSPSSPTLEDPAVINAPYSGTLQCNSLVLNNNITLTNDDYVEIVYGASGSGKIIMSSETSVVQRDQSSGAPNIELTKSTRLMKRYDYIYWGTPITGNFLSQIDGAIAQGSSTANAFDYRYKYVSGPPPNNRWQALDAITTGRGFITRIKDQSPFITNVATGKVDFLFNGVANNGVITVPVVNNPSCLDCGSSHNLLANPYPSAIDGVKFLRLNSSIDGAIYLWTSSTTNDTGITYYSQADYAVWNLAGTVNTSPTGQNVDGRIASGQSFFVKALGSGNVSFTNCMRLATGNNTFFRMSEDLPVITDRFKLNMTSAGDVFSQILIAYTSEASYGYDRLFDAGRNSVSTAQLYSVFEGDGRKLSINGRPTFDINDVVPLGVSKATTDAEQFSIGIQEKEGVFSDGSVIVYLHDKVLNLFHDLTTGNYNFTSNVTALNNRFEIVYQYNALNNPAFTKYNALATISHEVFKTVANNPIESIIIYDLLGQEIASYSNVNQKEFSAPFYHADGIYLTKIKLVSGENTTQKLVNMSLK